MKLFYDDESPSGLIWSDGSIAGTIDGSGYYMTQSNYIRDKNHRIIWRMYNGEIPRGYQVDHINGVRTDNQLDNLRIVTPSENSRNRKKQSNNTSGICKMSIRAGRRCIVVQWTDEHMKRKQKTFGYARTRSLEEALELAKDLVKQVSVLYSERHGLEG